MSVAVGVSVHSLTAYPVTTFGTPEQQEALLPGMLSGDQLGAYCLSEPLAGSRHRLDDDPGGGRGRERRRAHGIPAARPQGLDQPRRPRRLLHDLRAHVRRRRPRPVLLRRPRRRAGPVVRHARAEDGPALRHRARGDVRRRAGRRLPPDRRRGAGHGDRAVGTGCRPPRDRRRRNRSGAVGPRPRGLVRQGAAAVRPRHRGQPGPRLPPRRHGGRGDQRPRDLPARRAAQGRRTRSSARRPRSPSSPRRMPRCG